MALAAFFQAPGMIAMLLAFVSVATASEPATKRKSLRGGMILDSTPRDEVGPRKKFQLSGYVLGRRAKSIAGKSKNKYELDP